MKLDTIQKAFLRGYKTGQESVMDDIAPFQVYKESKDNNSVKTYKIGQILEDGYIYAGIMMTPEKSWHIALAPEDYAYTKTWNEAMDLCNIPTKDEWAVISVNKSCFKLKDSYYWASTENGSNNAWNFGSYFGSLGNNNKTNKFLVRCVRRF